MSKDFKFHSATVGKQGLNANFDLDEGVGFYAQDVSHFEKQAKLDREREEHFGRRKDGYRKLATIPDAVAIKILQDHGLDLHDPEFMHDADAVARLKAILVSEYRSLVVNT